MQPVGPFDFVAMNLLGSFPESSQSHQYILIIFERYSKPTRRTHTSTTMSTHNASHFYDHEIVPRSISPYILKDNGKQFNSECSSTICFLLDIQRLTTTSYHPQTNGQAESYNKTILTRLRHYVAEHQNDWDPFVEPLKFAYYTQIRGYTNQTPYRLLLRRHPPGPMIIRASNVVTMDAFGEISLQLLCTRVEARVLELLDEVYIHSKICRNHIVTLMTDAKETHWQLVRPTLIMCTDHHLQSKRIKTLPALLQALTTS